MRRTISLGAWGLGWAGGFACVFPCGAQTVMLRLPSGVAYDSAGNLYVADARRQQVLETMLSGVTVVVAGTGEQGFAGDGGAATAALLNAPSAVAVGADGTVYIADAGNQRVRAVAAGKIQTVAGTGVRGYSGDGGAGTAAMLSGPVGVAVDAEGGVLIADAGNQRVRRLLGGVIATFAGNGVQGFGGDGEAATAAMLDTPTGVAVAGDGRVFVADSHNHRVRVVGTDGKIATFAGSGVRGFGGDGRTAVGAMLWLPRGVAVMPSGDVVFADSDNQRLRAVDATGVIRTVAGSGVQGASAEGAVGVSAALDSPRGVAVSGFGTAAFGDARNRVVREVATDADLYALLGGASHGVSVGLTVPAALTYGQGVASVSVSGVAPAVQGSVALLDGGVPVGSGALAGGSATVGADGLAAGTHVLTAGYAGDGVHGAAVSPAVNVRVAQAVVVATAEGATIAYGGFATGLTGTATGILARDAGTVAVKFVAGAPDLAGVGTYPITAALTGVGSGNYAVTMGAGSGTLQIVQAGVVVTMTAPQVSYAGLPLTLSAAVGPLTRGTPTGVVSFFDGGLAVGSGGLVGGVASTVLLAPGVGTHAISAAYGGDGNFLVGTPAASSITVSAMPDFSLGVTGSATQTVQGGAIASYVLQVAGAPGPFSGSVSMSASGLPKGATVSFSPVAVVPGNGSASVTMSVQTIALAVRETKMEAGLAGLVVVLFVCRRKRLRGLMVALAAAVLVASGGCGDRSFSTSAKVAAQTFAITVTATSTNLAGTVVVHTTPVVLVVQ